MNAYATWFGRVVWLGVVVNVVLALPALFAPAWILSLLRLEAAVPLMWVQFSANLLILLSLFYIPAAIDLYRYKANAVLAVASRLAGVTFFFLLIRQPDYFMFGFLDLTFAIPEGILLALALRANPAAQSQSYS